MAARRESFFALEARPRRAEAVEVLGEKMFMYAAMSALGGGGIWWEKLVRIGADGLGREGSLENERLQACLHRRHTSHAGHAGRGSQWHAAPGRG